MSKSLKKICAISDLSPGQLKRIELDGRDPMVLCNDEGTFRLLDDECTHAIASLSDGTLVGQRLVCPLHGGSFDVRTGKPVTLPCKQALQTYAVEVMDGAVWFAAD